MKILKNPSLLHFNTFKVEAKAREVIIIEVQDDFNKLLGIRDLSLLPYLIIGSGSNVLFTKDFQGTIIKPETNSINLLNENDDHAWLKVDAGMNWHSLVEKSIELGYQGLENLSLIPGTVGAAPIQNIGAYGVEIQQFIEQVEALDLRGGEFFHFDRDDCEFGYRSSIFKTRYKDRFLITSVIFKLNKKPNYNTSYNQIEETLGQLDLKALNPRNISAAIIHIRRNKLPDPDKIGNAGSFYKNPVVDRTDLEGLKAEFPEIKAYQVDQEHWKISAAWLIESCGWKGKHYGRAGVYQNQPLVLVNLGGASGMAIFELSEKIKEDVMAKFGLILQTEVNII